MYNTNKHLYLPLKLESYLIYYHSEKKTKFSIKTSTLYFYFFLNYYGLRIYLLLFRFA